MGYIGSVTSHCYVKMSQSPTFPPSLLPPTSARTLLLGEDLQEPDLREQQKLRLLGTLFKRLAFLCLRSDLTSDGSGLGISP